jgi:hypothetical protein
MSVETDDQDQDQAAETASADPATDLDEELYRLLSE